MAAARRLALGCTLTAGEVTAGVVVYCLHLDLDGRREASAMSGYRVPQEWKTIAGDDAIEVGDLVDRAWP